MKDNSPATDSGDGRSVVVPSPSWPHSLWPQQYALPVDVSPQLWLRLAIRLVKARCPLTAPVEVVQFQLPLPIWPYELDPQQYAEPFQARPHVCS